MKKLTVLFATLALIIGSSTAFAQPKVIDDEDPAPVLQPASQPATKTLPRKEKTTPVPAVTREEFDALKKVVDNHQGRLDGHLGPEGSIVLTEESAEKWFWRFIGAALLMLVVALFLRWMIAWFRKERKRVTEEVATTKALTEATVEALVSREIISTEDLK